MNPSKHALKICTFYDSKGGAYTNPFYQRSTAEALRTLERLVNDPQSGGDIYVYPSDFTLFEIGEWDQFTGVITMYESKKSLGLAIEFRKEEPAPISMGSRQPSHIHAQG